MKKRHTVFDLEIKKFEDIELSKTKIANHRNFPLNSVYVQTPRGSNFTDEYESKLARKWILSD